MRTGVILLNSSLQLKYKRDDYGNNETLTLNVRIIASATLYISDQLFLLTSKQANNTRPVCSKRQHQLRKSVKVMYTK